MDTMPSTSSSPVNLSSSAVPGGCSKTRKSFLIDSLLDSILERKKASFVLRNNSHSLQLPCGANEGQFEPENEECGDRRKTNSSPLKIVDCGDEEIGEIISNSSSNKTCLPPTCEARDNQPLAAPPNLSTSLDDSSGAPPSDPSPSTPHNHHHLNPNTSKSNIFNIPHSPTPNQQQAFLSLFNRFGGFPSTPRDMAPFIHQQQLEHLHRLTVLQNTFGLAPINQDLVSNLQKSALVQQQMLATNALRQRMAAAMAHQANSKIELAHKKLLSKHHKPTAIATSLVAFRAALAASSMVSGRSGGKGKGVRGSPSSSSSNSASSTSVPTGGNASLNLGGPNGKREGGRRPNGSAPRSSNAKKYRCDICEKTFSRSNTLITHKRIHTGEKPFQCEHCGRAFRQPGNLTRHAYTHTTVKPFVCGECGKAFNRASNLHTHQRVHTQHSGSEDN